MPDDDRIASALFAATDWSGVVDLSGFDAAQDKLAARVPSLVAAIEAVLKLADEARVRQQLTLPGGGVQPFTWDLDPAKVREAITAELTKGEDRDAR